MTQTPRSTFFYSVHSFHNHCTIAEDALVLASPTVFTLIPPPLELFFWKIENGIRSVVRMIIAGVGKPYHLFLVDGQTEWNGNCLTLPDISEDQLIINSLRLSFLFASLFRRECQLQAR
jgi:hypothetical protein